MNGAPLAALVGLPDTGKTTYLVALWNAVQTPSDSHRLKLERYPAAAVYLNDMHARWLRGEPVGHTPRDGSELVELALSIGGRSFDLQVPDLSGETFEQMVVERRVASEVDELLLGASGLIVFTHPDHLRPRITIAQATAVGAANDPDVADPSGRPPSLDRRTLPAELHAIDLLQAIHLRRRNAGLSLRLRTAIVVSAWDAVADEQLTPAGWVEARMPMLHAYLTALESGDHRVYGVSAQGGIAGTGIGEQDPATRAWVVEADGSPHHDVTAPLVWAAGLE